MSVSNESRIVSWFSCGAASAVATKLAIAESDQPVIIAYCEVAEEHPDNQRFLRDCEKWFGQNIIVMGNDKFDRSIYNVFDKVNFLSGPHGARCTGELKKSIRIDFQKPNDRQVFGYTVEEQNRVDRFIDSNNDADIWPILVEKGLTKDDCLAMIERAGIELPAMYHLGYKNNNCRGCVKSSSPEYWKKIEVDFFGMFQKMNGQEKRIGASVCKIDMKTVQKRYPDIYKELGSPPVISETGGSTYWRPQLHELPSDIEPMDNSHDIQCGIFCEIAAQGYEDD